MLEMICEELGVEVGEEWTGNDGFRYIIKSDGDITIRDTDNVYKKVIPGEIYESIIKGKLKPVWKPGKRDKYYIVEFANEELFAEEYWTNAYYDNELYNKGLIFKTKEEAIESANKMLNALKEED